MIINVRGAPGSGKSTLVRQFIFGLSTQIGASVKFEHDPDKKHPILSTYKTKDISISILGTYEFVLGGCDKVGTLEEVYSLLHKLAEEGRHVVFEGGGTSRDFEKAFRLHTFLLKQQSELVVLDLNISPNKCMRDIYTRRTTLKEFFIRPPEGVLRDGYKSIVESDYKTCLRIQKKFISVGIPYHRVGRKEGLNLLFNLFGLPCHLKDIWGVSVLDLMYFMREHYSGEGSNRLI